MPANYEGNYYVNHAHRGGFEITYDPVARHVTHLPPFIISRARVGTRGASPTLDLDRVAECRSKEGKNGNNEPHNLVE